MLYTLLLFVITACAQESSLEQLSSVSQEDEEKLIAPEALIDPNGSIIQTRFIPPAGFQRTIADTNSFGNYLRHLPLKQQGAEVKYFNGDTKRNYNVYEAVVDLPIGKRDLHQCADAIMRLRAEYLFEQKRYTEIHFNFTNGFRVDYSEWQKGKRIVVNGNKVSWRQKSSPSNSYTDFWKYLEIIFSYAGTLSLEKELKSISMDELEIGDVFIQGGSPGHAIIVVDMAIDKGTKEKIFLLAQSYMPAQELQILSNPNNLDWSPWYSSNIGQKLKTPEWTFKNTDLKRF